MWHDVKSKQLLFVVVSATIMMLGPLSFGAKLVGVQGLSPGSPPLRDSSKDPLVNEQKMREILADEKTDITKKVRFVQLYQYKRYAVSDPLIPFLVERMQVPELTLPILQLFHRSGWRFAVNELAQSCQSYAASCQAQKNWKGLDDLRDWIRRITPVEPLPVFDSWEFNGKDPEYGFFENSLWERSDEYLAYCIRQNDEMLTNCARKTLTPRFDMFLGKIKPDGSGITQELLSFYAGDRGWNALTNIGEKNVPKFLPLLDVKSSAMAMEARKILLFVLHVHADTDLNKWWWEHKANFSFKEHLLNIATGKNYSVDTREGSIDHMRMQAMRGDEDFDQTYLRKLVVILVDDSEPDRVRETAYRNLAWMIGDHSVLKPEAESWKDILIQPAAGLMERENFYKLIRFVTPAEIITGALREKFRKIAANKKLWPVRRGSATRALARGCLVYRNHVAEDARLALVVLADYASFNDELELYDRHQKGKPGPLKLSEGACEVSAIYDALEKMTGRTDCGYDIKKWRNVVAEMEARAMLGVGGGR